MSFEWDPNTPPLTLTLDARDPTEKRIAALEAQVERLTAERDERAVELRYLREIRGPGTCQCSDDDACRFALERDEARAEVERLTAEVEACKAVRAEAIRDNRAKTEAVRELQAALAGVLRSYEAYTLLTQIGWTDAGPPDDLDEYDEMMLPAWQRAASLVPGFDPRAAGPWVEPAALLGEETK
jgi:uncharacterized small protein (DUF1192 family)